MYENMTFENIMDRCLARVSASVDKREGSIVYDAIAPAAAELAILYIELAYLMDRAFPDTETGDDLTKKCRERSVFRTAATQAVRKGYFEKADGGGCDMEIGTRFSGGDINFTVTERIAPGQYSLTAETAGTVGNEYVGTLFPIDYVPELAAARLADILIPGEDEESDDALRAQIHGGKLYRLVHHRRRYRVQLQKTLQQPVKGVGLRILLKYPVSASAHQPSHSENLSVQSGFYSLPNLLLR